MTGPQKRRLLAGLYRAALEGVDPRAAVARALVDRNVVAALRGAGAVGVFAVGKAASGMVRGARPARGRCLAILPRGFPRPALQGVEVLFASHPEPGRSSLAAAKRALDFFSSFGPHDVILCLVSGGASSLLALPRRGLTMAEKRRRVARLAAGGASILEVNRLRTRLSAVKGGGLGRATPARLITLVLSDVPGDRPAAVGSGPTIRNRRGDLVRVVATNASGLAAAAEEARRLGWRPRLASARLEGEAREAGASLARRARKIRRGDVFLAGGETTVALSARRGRGGRSLELALAAALERKGEAGWAMLAAGSDGRDGSARAAGAFVDGATIERAARRGLDPAKALSRHDTERFFRKVGALFVTGPTGTNVADWVFALQE